MEAADVVIGFVDCPTLRMHALFLARRGYAIRPLTDPDLSVMVLCADHASHAAVRAAAAAFAGPKLALGFDPPASWARAQRLRTPLLPLDLEREIAGLCLGAPAPPGTYHVLVVEDDPTTSASVARTLQDTGFDVQTCGGYSEVARGLQRRPDFVVMDLNLPGLSGEKLGEIIGAKRIPVALFSSVSSERLERVRARIGAVAAFSKDTPLRAVSGWIRDYLDHARVMTGA